MRPGSRFWRRALAAGAVLGVGLCGAVVAVGLRLSAPALREVGPPERWGMALPGLEVVEIASGSGPLLRGWWLPAEAPGGGAVVLMHGAWDSRLGMVSRARVLHARGFSVLLFDFQAHGESPGRHITFGRREGMDAAAALGFVRRRLPGERLGAIAVSMGGAAALLGPEPLALDALVLESVYPDIESALANRLRAGLGPGVGWLAAPVLVPLFTLLLPPVLGVAPEELRPIERIAGVRAPVLVTSGAADERTTLREARSLFERAPEPRRFWVVPGAGHADLERHDPEGYWREVLPFLAGHLRARD